MGLSRLYFLMWLAHNQNLRYRRGDDIEDVDYEDLSDNEYYGND